MSNEFKTPEPLAPDQYFTALSLTQLVSVDLIIMNKQGEILLGKRKNAPAKDYFFVPGCRVFKHEAIKSAVARCFREELGVAIDEINLTPWAISEHEYPDNFRDNSTSTHYLSLAFFKSLDKNSIDWEIFANQHTEYLWLQPYQLLLHEKVHKFTKMFFDHTQATGKIFKL